MALSKVVGDLQLGNQKGHFESSGGGDLRKDSPKNCQLEVTQTSCIMELGMDGCTVGFLLNKLLL